MSVALRTDIWIAGLVRRAQIAGAWAAIVARGDDIAGDVAVKVNALNGEARLRSPSVGMAGERVWVNPLGDPEWRDEHEIDAYLSRRRDRDPDLWIVEIEDRQGRSFIEDAPDGE